MNQSMSKNISLILLSSISILAGTSLTAKGNETAQGNQLSYNQPNTVTNPAQIKWLGVSLGQLSPAMQSQLAAQLKNGAGVMITDVQAHSPAEKAGLRAFDVLTRFNKTPVANSQQVYSLVQQSNTGDAINIEYIRTGKKHTTSAKIGSREISPQQNWSQPFMGWPNGNQFGAWPNFGNDPFWNSPPRWNHPFFQNFDRSFNRGFDRDFNSGFDRNFTAPFYNFPAMPSFPDFPKDFGKQFTDKNGNNVQSFSQSESLSMETLKDGKIHIELKSKDTNNDEKKFVFEGKRDQIIKDIQQQKDLPEVQKQKLIGAIQGSFSTFFNSSDFTSSLDPDLQNSTQNKEKKRLSY
ncbi:PDZ domain-containing protein [Cocleimonas sp. KMM 6892]|uniref:S1C family serine protease n=1 Tax=unclassified Cocleimonas TaxID=2639732 RepID=UPI002DBD5851|nr:MULTISPECIES: PDZ domain-containing protein [unclassified Cocleimonas]MEB8430843.1 PDZ domain-containing protein [Cocleimonas sp. KMM 6892]MEC4714385.1 PDZ domain-containing protein [Cocleimonas sp. KMM 6895]MEC4743716.1 PDZ domain-containing protein [Cocleimonas sp. KMM 6896]